jgi:hypothetical protein
VLTDLTPTERHEFKRLLDAVGSKLTAGVVHRSRCGRGEAQVGWWHRSG